MTKLPIIQDTILRRIRAKKRGWVFTPKNFIDLASRNTIDVTLHRLVKKGIIRKLAHGIYDFPIHHPKLGMLTPGSDSIATAMVAKTGDAIHSSGARAANQLGIDTQVPAKPTYITSGKSIKKNIATYSINLHHSKYSSKKIFSQNVINTINALRHLGKNNISTMDIKQLDRILSNKDKMQLKKNISSFPDWIAPIILQLKRK